MRLLVHMLRERLDNCYSPVKVKREKNNHKLDNFTPISLVIRETIIGIKSQYYCRFF